MCRDAYFAVIATVRPAPSCPKRCFTYQPADSKAINDWFTRQPHRRSRVWWPACTVLGNASAGSGCRRKRSSYARRGWREPSFRSLVWNSEVSKSRLKLIVPFVKGRFGGRGHDAGHVEVSVGQGAYVVLILKGIKQVVKIPFTQLNLF